MGLFGGKKIKEEKSKKEGKNKDEQKVASRKTVPVSKEETSMKDLYSKTAPVKSKEENKNNTKKVASKIAPHLLIRPVVTEKATDLSAHNKYAFIVNGKANKIEVARAINTIYGVKPKAVNILNIKGKRVSRGRISGKRKDIKKAIITLKKGETIAIYEGV